MWNSHTSGSTPWKYVRDDSGAVVVDPAVASQILEAFHRYATGEHSLRDVTRWPAEAGLRSAKGNPMDRLSIRKLRTNPTYAGRVTFHARDKGGVLSEGKHPAIVDTELFAVVQETLLKRRFRRPDRPYGKEPYPLSATGTCGFCGAGLSGCASVKMGRHRYRYYRCSTAHRRGREACEQPMVREDVFETQIAAYIVGMRLPPEYLGEVMDELGRRNRSIGADPSGLEKRRRELGRWHRLFVLGEIDEETLSRETAPLKAALAEVDEPREAIDIREAMAYWAPFLVVWRPKRVAGKKFEN